VKAAAFYEYGPAEAMQYAAFPDPTSGPGDVLVQVQACGVNHSDLDSRAGTSRWPFELPMVLGPEFTGTVVDAGDRAGPIHPGDLVTALQQYSCGHCAQCAKWQPDLCAAFEIFGTTRWGGYGDLVSVPAEVVVPLDPGDDPLAMTAGQCVVSTAWHMVNRLAMVRPGDLVLVPAASGGVAGALVQCAKLAGATVVGTAAKAGPVTGLGADLVIVRNESDIATGLLRAPGGRRFDAVLDTVGGQLFGAHLSVLREEGTLVTWGAHAGEVVPLDLSALFRNGWRIVGFRIAPPDDLATSLELIRDVSIKVPIAAAFPVSDAAAHRFLERRQHGGKCSLLPSKDIRHTRPISRPHGAPDHPAARPSRPFSGRPAEFLASYCRAPGWRDDEQSFPQEG
jgi:NADPH:quinone reductase-like Zn-dependent oxidoreductase